MSDFKEYDLITAFVDGELDERECLRLGALLEKDQRLKNAVRSEKAIKYLIRSKAKRICAPAHLREKVIKLIQQANEVGKTEPAAQSEKDRISVQPPSKSKNIQPLIFAIAALFLIAISINLFRSQQALPEAHSVEWLTWLHFQNHEGAFIEPTLGAASTADAQQALLHRFDCNITVPELDGAEFAGVVYADFFEGYHVPLLEYKITEGDYIYIFAFELDKLDEKTLPRDARAVDAIVSHNDVFIADISGMDVVSWKWGDVWYSAVSHHSGEVIAAMLPH